jgi:hypothetical protein
MNKSKSILLIVVAISSCTSVTNQEPAALAVVQPRDTLTYAYKATYSSDITVPGNPVNAQKVLQVWKMFETVKIDEMKTYFADSVNYHDAHGMHFFGPAEKLLSYAKKDIEGLDSMRFDIISWQSAHVNDKNEDWVNIWSTERRYGKNGAKADTVLMQENWKVKDGKVIYFDQYLATP